MASASIPGRVTASNSRYSKDKTDQSYADFVASEKARLGVTDDDRLLIFRPVAPADVRKVT
jgi:predicted nucleic acid-binding protein